MIAGAFRICPFCHTRSKSYMLVCTKCSRSLERVPLSGVSAETAFPPSSVLSSRGVRFALVAGVAAAIGVGILVSRVLRAPALEGEAAASELSPTSSPSPKAAAQWETIEERWAEVTGGGPTGPTAAGAHGASAPPPPESGPTPALARVASASAVSAVPRPSPWAAPASTRRDTEPIASETGRDFEAQPDGREARQRPDERIAPTVPEQPTEGEWPDEGRAKDVERRSLPAEAQKDLRRAEQRIRGLERQAAELRGRMTEPIQNNLGESVRLGRQLAHVMEQIEEAEREVIRAQWALRRVEPRR